MSALAIIDIFPVNKLFLLLLIVTMGSSHSPVILASQGSRNAEVASPDTKLYILSAL